ncbi:MAG: hypothetical protein GW856_02725 [Cyanobacteria bacterium]|nr:hypothetical protein [Cyanobacteria bacterium CG_2015-16_32_12]
MSTTILATIALNLAYEIEIEGNISLEDIRNYPKSRGKLPIEILSKIENPKQYGQLVDQFVEVIEVIDLDEELGL